MAIKNGDKCLAPGGPVLTHRFNGTRQWLVGPEATALVLEKAATMAGQYKSIVARRTGELEKSTELDIGIYVDEEAGVTGYVRATARHAAPHEFGWVDNLGFKHAGSHEFREVLRMNGA